MSVFRFKEFSVNQTNSAMKVGTDAMLLGALAFGENPTQILDIGAGTGVLSLMMAQQYPQATITAVELDSLSAKECTENFNTSKWSSRMTVLFQDFLAFESGSKFDLIISNPPYYQSRLENDDPRKARARHEASLPVLEMLTRIKELLSVHGDFWVIIPSETKTDWLEKAESQELFCANEIEIFGKKNAAPKRCILSFHHARSKRRTSSLIVRDEAGCYTEHYIKLTSHFHWNDLRSLNK